MSEKKTKPKTDGKCHLHDDCIHQKVCDHWILMRRDEMKIRMEMQGCGFYEKREVASP